MSELDKIRSVQRIHPPLQDQHVGKKLKDERRDSKDRKRNKKNTKPGKVDEYI